MAHHESLRLIGAYHHKSGDAQRLNLLSRKSHAASKHIMHIYGDNKIYFKSFPLHIWYGATHLPVGGSDKSIINVNEVRTSSSHKRSACIFIEICQPNVRTPSAMRILSVNSILRCWYFVLYGVIRTWVVTFMCVGGIIDALFRVFLQSSTLAWNGWMDFTSKTTVSKLFYSKTIYLWINMDCTP